jgi:ABC-2 type transport system permease protein
VLQLAGHEFTLFRVGRLLQGVIVLVWASHHLGLEWDIARVALLVFTMLATFFFFYGLVILGAVMSFWTTESLEIMNMLTYGGVETAQYPMAVYQKYFQRFFTFVVPLAMVTYFPILAVLDIPDPLGTTRTWQIVAPTGRLRFLRRLPVDVARWRTALHLHRLVIRSPTSFRRPR